MRFLRLVLLSAAVPALIHAQELPASLDSISAAWGKERGFMGSVLVAKDGKVVLEKGYGLANIEWDIPNTPDTKFRLGSITKQFTATAVLQLEEQGKLTLDESACKYLTECPEAWKPITVQQLLNHTSGIVSYTGLPDFPTPKRMRIPLSPFEIVMLTKDNKLDFQPGEGWKYNNTGYVLLGHIIEKASGAKYDEYLTKHIFDPLDMKDSGYDWSRPVLKRRASGYSYDRSVETWVNADYLDMSLPHAAGSLYSTVRDLYRWDRALYTDRLLKKPSLDRMFTPARSNYGYGWVIDTTTGRRRTGHGGGINGFSTMIARYPEQDAVVIVLSNVQNAGSGDLAAALSKALFREKVELPWDRKAADVDPKIFARYAGTYQMPPFKIAVTVGDGKLMVQPDRQPKLQAFPESETKFFLRVVDASFEFVPGEDGNAKELILRQGGQELRGKRIQ